MLKKFVILLFCCTATRAVNPAFTPDLPPVTDTETTDVRENAIDSTLVDPLPVTTGEDIVNTAMKYLGKRYLRGHRGPNAFDCSGFTSYVYEKEGIRIGRSSRDQFREGEKVKLADLRKGDLVFFGQNGSRRHINHVGIVADVDSTGNRFRFIHACRRGVAIDTYPDVKYYVSRYVSARRILSE